MSLFVVRLLCREGRKAGRKIRFKRTWISAVCFSFFLFQGLHASSQDSSGANQFEYNLEQCIDYAMKNQHDVVNARLNQAYANEQVLENRGKLLPHADITGSLIKNLKLATTLIPDVSGGNPNQKIPVQFGSKNTSAISGEITQTVFNSNYFLGLKAARVFTELSSHSTNVTEVGTQVNVTKAYYSVLVTREGLRISQSNLDQISKALKDIKAKYNAGVSETVDVNRIQVQYNNALTGIENQQRLMDLSLQQLKFQMGMPQKDQLELTQTVNDFAPDQIGIVDSTAFLIIDRPEYAVQQSQILLNELSLKSVRLSYLPSLSAYLNYGRNYFSSTFVNIYNQGFGSSAVGLSLTLPLFQGTERTHQVNEAKISLRQSQNDLDHLAEQIHLEIKEAYTNLVNNNTSLKTQKENMELTQGVFDRIRYKFDQGVSSSLDLLSAENELQQAQSNYIDALLNTLMSKVDLDRAMGKLNR